MLKLASEKQLAFIRSLMAERDTPKLDEQTLASMDMRHASQTIERLLALPRKPVVTVAAKINFPEANETLAKVPNAKYAVPTDALRPYLVNTDLRGDLLFVEVRTYKDRKYVRRLHGAPGNFTRTRFSVADGVQVVAQIALDPAAAALAFSIAYTCCAACCAPLTDEESRARGLGPICAKRFE